MQAALLQRRFLNVRSKAEWDWGLKLNLPVMGEVNEGIKGSVEALKTISYSYDLSGMHNYTAYNAQNSLSFIGIGTQKQRKNL